MLFTLIDKKFVLIKMIVFLLMVLGAYCTLKISILPVDAETPEIRTYYLTDKFKNCEKSYFDGCGLRNTIESQLLFIVSYTRIRTDANDANWEFKVCRPCFFKCKHYFDFKNKIKGYEEFVGNVEDNNNMSHHKYFMNKRNNRWVFLCIKTQIEEYFIVVESSKDCTTDHPLYKTSLILLPLSIRGRNRFVIGSLVNKRLVISIQYRYFFYEIEETSVYCLNKENKEMLLRSFLLSMRKKKHLLIRLC